jgi:hypothetical protein
MNLPLKSAPRQRFFVLFQGLTVINLHGISVTTMTLIVEINPVSYILHKISVLADPATPNKHLEMYIRSKTLKCRKII